MELTTPPHSNRSLGNFPNHGNPPRTTPSNNIPQEGSDKEFWDIDLYDLLTPTPEVGFDEEDEENNEDYIEPATKYNEETLDSDKTEPKYTLSEENGKEETNND